MEMTRSPLQPFGFLLAAAAVIGNDSLQTLFLCTLLWVVLVVGWRHSEGEPAWGRLAPVPLQVLSLTRPGCSTSDCWATGRHCWQVFWFTSRWAGCWRSPTGRPHALPGNLHQAGCLPAQWLASGWLWGRWRIQDLARWLSPWLRSRPVCAYW